MSEPGNSSDTIVLTFTPEIKQLITLIRWSSREPEVGKAVRQMIGRETGSFREEEAFIVADGFKSKAEASEAVNLVLKMLYSRTSDGVAMRDQQPLLNHKQEIVDAITGECNRLGIEYKFPRSAALPDIMPSKRGRKKSSETPPVPGR